MAATVPSFVCGIEPRSLADWLIKQAAAKDYDRVITYSEMSDVAGVDVQEKRGVLTTARNVVHREAGLVFGTVIGQGVKLCTSAEIVGIGDHALRHVRKTTGKAIRKMASVKFEELSSVDQVRHNTTVSFLGAMRLMTNASSRKRLEGAVAAKQARLEVRDTLNLFGGAPNGEAK
jgi:hypothetical protein